VLFDQSCKGARLPYIHTVFGYALRDPFPAFTAGASFPGAMRLRKFEATLLLYDETVVLSSK